MDILGVKRADSIALDSKKRLYGIRLTCGIVPVYARLNNFHVAPDLTLGWVVHPDRAFSSLYCHKQSGTIAPK